MTLEDMLWPPELHNAPQEGREEEIMRDIVNYGDAE
jgi:hypothetical protein